MGFTVQGPDGVKLEKSIEIIDALKCVEES